MAKAKTLSNSSQKNIVIISLSMYALYLAATINFMMSGLSKNLVQAFTDNYALPTVVLPILIFAAIAIFDRKRPLLTRLFNASLTLANVFAVTLIVPIALDTICKLAPCLCGGIDSVISGWIILISALTMAVSSQVLIFKSKEDIPSTLQKLFVTVTILTIASVIVGQVILDCLMLSIAAKGAGSTPSSIPNLVVLLSAWPVLIVAYFAIGYTQFKKLPGLKGLLLACLCLILAIAVQTSFYQLLCFLPYEIGSLIQITGDTTAMIIASYVASLIVFAIALLSIRKRQS
jgi:hypothetical protein